MEAALPQAIAEDDRVGSAEVLFFRCEVAAEERIDAQDLKKARRDKAHGELLRQRAGDLRHVAGVVAADGGEGGVHAVPVLQARGSNEAIRVAIADVVLIDLEEAIAVGVGQGAEDDCIDCGEDGAVGADAEREREDDCGGERRRTAQKAHGSAAIERESLDQLRGVDFANPLANLFAPAKFQDGAAAGFLRREAGFDAVLHEPVDVEADLAVEFRIVGWAAEGAPAHFFVRHG